MKIALVCNVFPGVSGETAFFRRMERFLLPRLLDEGYHAELCPVAHTKLPLLSSFETYSRFPLLLNCRSRLKDYAGYDVVHFLNASLVPAGGFLRMPKLIATAHQLSHSTLPPPTNPLTGAARRAFSSYSSFLDAGMRTLDAIVACTPFQASDLRRMHPDSNVEVISPGIDPERLRNLRRKDLGSEYGCEKVLAYVGRLHEESKGVSYAIRAMAHLEQDYRLLLVGEGPDEWAYRRLVRRLGLEKKVVFTGALGEDEKSLIQKSADAAIVPSLRDVFCTVFAEFLACRVPVVALERPFWKGLYDDAAFFVPPDPAALAEASARAASGHIPSSMRNKAEELSSFHDVRNTVERYLELYENC